MNLLVNENNYAEKLREPIMPLFFIQLSSVNPRKTSPTAKSWARISAGAPASATPAWKGTSSPCLLCSPARGTGRGAGKFPSASVSTALCPRV